MAKTYKTEGFVLKRTNFAEADKLITIFSKHYGKIRGIAKGIRKPASRKGGNLDLFNYSVVFLVKGKNLDIITQAQVINPFPQFKKNLKKVAVAYQLIELVDRITRENQTNRQTFLLLKESLFLLEKEKIDLAGLVFDFKKKLLEINGFGLPAVVNLQSVESHLEKIIEKKVKSFYD